VPTEKEIREAIAAKIATAAPLAVVLPRNILGIKNGAWLSMLQSAADSNKVRGWFVTLVAQTLTERRIGGAAEYEFKFRIVQFMQYETGDDDSNSEDSLSAERAAVVTAFMGDLADPLGKAEPPDFSLIDIDPIGQNGLMVHFAEGTITVKNVVGC
jgi:hypothetical protein